MIIDASRRRFVSSALCACGACLVSPVLAARESPGALTSAVTRDYRPQDQDERGLWDICASVEQQLEASNLRIKDPALNESLLGIMRRLLPEQADKIRVFAMWSPDFNAAMFPNGLMIVNSGFLARARNEAQVAAVLGHESGHYLRRHTLQTWRNRRNATAVMAFVAVGAGAASGVTGSNWYDVANAINSGLLLSVFRHSRELEGEADSYGLQLMTNAGYAPDAAGKIWKQLIEERKASAAVRKKKYRDSASSALSTHPPSEERMGRLTTGGMFIERAKEQGITYDDGRERWLTATANLRAAFIDEQVKQNDPGASLYLIESLSADGWDGTLRYYEGEAYRLRDEAGDADRAATSYAAAVSFPDAMPEAHRAHGYAQLKKGDAETGRRALSRYLELRPDASDAAMVRFTLGQ